MSINIALTEIVNLEVSNFLYLTERFRGELTCLSKLDGIMLNQTQGKTVDKELYF
jgi:hypothetical protein